MRTEVVPSRVTPTERALLEAAARRAGRSVSSYVRRAAMTRVREDLPELHDDEEEEAGAGRVVAAAAPERESAPGCGPGPADSSDQDR